MGKNKKGFNWKARQVVNVKIDDSWKSKIKIDPSLTEGGKYDENNLFVLPSDKRKTKKIHESVTIKRILSKKQRKHLEKIVERKKKKEKRAELLEALSKVQPHPELMNQLTSIASIQTKGLRKCFQERERGEETGKRQYPNEEEVKPINSVSGSRKRKRLELLNASANGTTVPNDPNIVGFETSSDEDEDSEGSEEENIENGDSKISAEEGGGENTLNGDVKMSSEQCEIDSDKNAELEGASNSEEEILRTMVECASGPMYCNSVSARRRGGSEESKDGFSLTRQGGSEDIKGIISSTGEKTLKDSEEKENNGFHIEVISPRGEKALKDSEEKGSTNGFCIEEVISRRGKKALNDSEEKESSNGFSIEIISPRGEKTLKGSEERESTNGFSIEVISSRGEKSLKDSEEKENKGDCSSTRLEGSEDIEVISSTVEEAKDRLEKESENGKKLENEKLKEIRKPAVFVPVNRREDIQEARLKLPILAEEQIIMETINENPVVILAGETGSGKTTQVPQFLYEAGYARDGKIIGVTEPRRVAAISMSKRVAEEMSLSSKEVSYLIRFEGNATDDTKIKFMTDGVLLKEIQSDFLLTKYSVIILDEAHERSVYTDILIGLLSRIVPVRNKRNNPLKLIIMSATLRLEDFTENPRLFKVKPPVITVESRQYPVTIHFNKRTATDYVAEAFKKACKIHTQLPSGGILIFVTGQQEVNSLVRKLRRAFPFQNKKTKVKENKKDGSQEEVDEEEMDIKKAIQNARKAKRKQDREIVLPVIDLDSYSIMPGDDTEVDLLGQDDDLGDVESDEEDGVHLQRLNASQPMWVLPLYSLLPSDKQAEVFKPPPEGCRLCVVATNVAETSLTIPNVRYVVDTGRMKTRLYDKVTGVSAFTVTWCSKAAANQRAGRAGRMGPGHCYRLYSSAVYDNQFEQFAAPEIQRKPVDDLMLQMKAMNIDKVVNFPFPSPPDLEQLMSAERRLVLLGALKPPESKDDWTSKVTPLGYAISAFPVAPRFGKMLALSHQQGLLPYTVCMVAALSVQEVLLEVPIHSSETDSEHVKRTRGQWAQTRRMWAGVGNSLLLGDPMVLLRAVGAAEYRSRKGELEKFCAENGLRHKAVVEIRKLRVQLTNEVNLNLPDLNLCVDPNMPPPTDVQAKLLCQILLAGMPDQVALKIPEGEIKENVDKAKWKHAYRCAEMEDPVFMHSASVLRKTCPEWVVYQEVFETAKLYMRGVTAIEPEWLPVYAPALCNLSPPLLDPSPRFDETSGKMYCYVTGTFGRAGWQLPVMDIEFPPSLDRFKWFACFLLEGSVFPKLKKYAKSLLSIPQTMVKSWAKLQPRTEILLKALVSRGVDSKEKLLEAWNKDSSYLLSAYHKWVPESAYNEIALDWPPIGSEG